VTSVTSSGSYGGLTLTGSTGPTAATVVLGGTTGTWPISISGNSSNSTNIIGATCNLFYYTRYILSTISSNLRKKRGWWSGVV
jgi:hypothetical protein